MPSKQLVILANSEDASSMPAIATRRELLRDLFNCNTGPQRAGEDTLYGPGIRLELSPGQDPVTQMLLTIDDEDIGWQTIMRLAKKFNWKMLDPITGRELTPR